MYGGREGQAAAAAAVKAAVGALEPRSAVTYVAAVCDLEPQSAAMLPRSAASRHSLRLLQAADRGGLSFLATVAMP